MRILASLLALSLTAPVLAEQTKTEFSDYLFISPFFDYTNMKNSDGLIDKDSNLGFGFDLGYRNSEKWAYRLRAEKLDLDETNFQGNAKGYNLGMDAMYFLKENTYLYGGVRNVKLHKSEFGPAIGIGHHFTVNEDWKVRLEAGVMKDFGSNFTFSNVSLGVTYRFGSVDKYKTARSHATIPVYQDKPIKSELYVKFSHDSSIIEVIYMDELQRVANFLNTYPNTKATFEGHTSSIGSNKYNMALSERRAKAVTALLIEKFNIDPDRLFAKGFGEEQLLNTSNTLEAHKMNRRVIAVLEAVE